VDIYSEELIEFKNQIQEDTKLITEQASKETGGSISAVIGIINGNFNTNTQSRSNNEELPTITNDQLLLDSRQASIIAVQENAATYLEDPEDKEEYIKWQQLFDVSTKIEQISTMLAANEKLRNHHSKLVPKQVTYSDFWKRYFFRLEQLDQKEMRKAAVINRAAANEEPLTWDDDDDALTKELEARSKSMEMSEITEKKCF